MRQVCILGNGDSVDKIKYEYSNCDSVEKLSNKIAGYNVVQLVAGNSDITVVKNYFPYFVYKIKKDETILDIMSRGFDCGGVFTAGENDTIVISKPRSIRYIVKPLETLDEISCKIGVEKNKIMEVNNLSTDRLFVGQILWI